MQNFVPILNLLEFLNYFVFKMRVPNMITSNVLREYVMVFIVNLSVVTSGMSFGWPSPMLLKLQDPSQSNLSRPITTDEGSWLASLGFLLSVFANVPSGYLIDWIGRKWTLLLMVLPKLCGCFLLIYGKEVWVLILARGLILTCDSVVFITVPVYSSELARKEYRGTLGTFLQIFCSLGIVISFAVGPFVSYMTFNIILTCMIAGTGLPLLFVVESPYYMYSKGKIAHATKNLIYLRDSKVAAELEIEEYKNTKNSPKISRTSLLRSKLYLKSFALAALVSVGSQIIGYNAVSYYTQTILESSNTNVRSEYGSVIIGVIQLVASFCTAAITDRFGRRPVIIASLLTVLLGMIGLGVFFLYSEDPEYEITGLLNYLPTASLVIITFGFGAGIGSLTWLLSAELFDGPARAFGVSSVLTLTMFVIFIWTRYFPLMTLSLGATNTYWIFSANCVIILTLIYLFVPETKGKSFGEIQKIVKERTFNFGRVISEKEYEKEEKPDLGNGRV